MRQFYRLLISHFKEIIREPAVIFWGIVFPILMAGGLGLAFNKKPVVSRNIVLIASSSSNEALPSFLTTKLSLKKIEPLKGNVHFQYSYSNKSMGQLTLNFYPANWSQANEMLKKGIASVVIESKNGVPDYHFDPMNPEALLLHLQLTGLLEKGPAFFEENTQHAKALTLPGTRYIDFLVPGLIGMGIMMACMWGISYSVIEKRSKKLLRRMVATPMKKPFFLGSLFVARITMNFIEGFLLFLFAYLFFGTAVQGSGWALFILFVAGNIAFSGLAVLISSRTANPEVGTGLINAFVTPMMVLSGVFFSYHSFPDWIITIIRTLPLTMLIDSFRAVFNEGAGIMDVALSSLILLIEGTVFFIAGLKLYKWY